jgi:hypothetical protein
MKIEDTEAVQIVESEVLGTYATFQIILLTIFQRL